MARSLVKPTPVALSVLPSRPLLEEVSCICRPVSLFKLTGLDRQWIHVHELIVWFGISLLTSFSEWMILTKQELVTLDRRPRSQKAVLKH